MENKSEPCYTCIFFRRYYIKGDTKFIMTKIGYCVQKKKEMVAKEHCEKYCRKFNLKRNNQILQNTLDTLLAEITTIRQIIEAEKNEM